jgi:NADPH2:quinone reductase
VKAVVITGSGPAEVLKIQERPIPPFSENQVLIEVNAAGVNRPDVAQRRGKYPAPAGYPQIYRVWRLQVSSQNAGRQLPVETR